MTNFLMTAVQTGRTALFVGVTGALIIGLSGCATSQNDPAVVPVPGVTADAEQCSGDFTELGDVIVAEGVVTDEFGEYCRTMLNPEANVATYDSTLVDVASLTEFGFTEADAEKAQGSAVKFLVEETLDSTRLDNYGENASAWVDAHTDFISPSILPAYVDAASSGSLVDTSLAVSDLLPEPIVRDGGPRAKNTVVKVVGVHGEAGSSTGEPTLLVELSYVVDYVAPSETVLAAVLRNNPDESEETLLASSPDLFIDGDVKFTVSGRQNFGFGMGNYGQVTGSAMKFDVVTEFGTVIGSVK